MNKAARNGDLARWLQARGAEDGSTVELVRLKRDVIEADQVLDALMKCMGSGGGIEGTRNSPNSETTTEQRKAVEQQIAAQALKARQLREAFRAERERLIRSNPRFGSAFELPSVQQLRQAAGHAQCSALLCLLELPHPEAQPGDGKPPRCVGAFLHHHQSRPTRLLEFPTLHDTARHALAYEPNRDRDRRPALRDSESDTQARMSQLASGTALPPGTSAATLSDSLREALWDNLQQIRDQAQAEGAPLDQLHLRGHGLLQLPEGLRTEKDCPGLKLIAWPGLPYLRLAAATADGTKPVATRPAAGASWLGNKLRPPFGRAHPTPPPKASTPWLIGHDCAWGSAQPLPMVAVEAALLRQLAQQHGIPVQPLAQGRQVDGDSAALVLCCHGARAGAEESHFDSELRLGSDPLSARKIVQQRLGPPLTLLPACHAGETLGDSAGNALGLAAGFLLGGTRVVVASAKAVPDLLIPWFTTLLSWHILHDGMSLYDAATTARRECGACEFPESYRQWLTGALPQALAALQPGGAEQSGIETARAAMAKTHGNHVTAEDVMAPLCDNWPWQGHVWAMFSANAKKRQEAVQSAASNVLRLREDRADAIRQQMREMAAFIFVYGVG